MAATRATVPDRTHAHQPWSASGDTHTLHAPPCTVLSSHTSGTQTCRTFACRISPVRCPTTFHCHHKIRRSLGALTAASGPRRVTYQPLAEATRSPCSEGASPLTDVTAPSARPPGTEGAKGLRPMQTARCCFPAPPALGAPLHPPASQSPALVFLCRTLSFIENTCSDKKISYFKI